MTTSVIAVPARLLAQAKPADLETLAETFHPDRGWKKAVPPNDDRRE